MEDNEGGLMKRMIYLREREDIMQEDIELHDEQRRKRGERRERREREGAGQSTCQSLPQFSNNPYCE